MANEIIKGKTPENWIRASYPSRKPLKSWINDLSNRIKYSSSKNIYIKGLKWIYE